MTLRLLTLSAVSGLLSLTACAPAPSLAVTDEVAYSRVEERLVIVRRDLEALPAAALDPSVNNVHVVLKCDSTGPEPLYPHLERYGLGNTPADFDAVIRQLEARGWRRLKPEPGGARASLTKRFGPGWSATASVSVHELIGVSLRADVSPDGCT